MKILITYIEAGNGHRVASQAIADALREQIKDKDIEIIEKNIFETDPKLQKYENFLINEVKKASLSPFHSNMQLFSMHLLGAQNTLKLVNGGIYRKVRNLYVEKLKEIDPDIIIDTHYFCVFSAVSYRNKYKPSCKVITYDPDNNVHGWWDTRVDKFVVNNEYAFHQAFRRGFKETQVKQVPFITRKSVLDTTESKEFYRKKYNIPKSDFVVKLADGIYGEAKMKSYIYELIKIEKPLSIIAIAGKNEALYNELTQLKNSLPSHIHLFPFPFVKEINELIMASDIFITKAGPNAVLDSVYLNVPVIINYYANVIEKTTKRVFIDKYKCGLYIPNKKECKSYIEKCIDNHSILDEFIENTKQFDKTKNGAPEIAKIILDEIK